MLTRRNFRTIKFVCLCCLGFTFPPTSFELFADNDVICWAVDYPSCWDWQTDACQDNPCEGHLSYCGEHDAAGPLVALGNAALWEPGDLSAQGTPDDPDVDLASIPVLFR